MSPFFTCASSASPSCVLVCSGSSSRLAPVRHISRSRLLLIRGRFGPARQQHRRKPLENIDLLILVQSARDAAPKDPPIDLVLHLIGELKSAGVDAAGLLDAEIVAREIRSRDAA